MSSLNSPAEQFYKQAQTLFEQNNMTGAIEALKKSINDSPSVKAYRVLGYILKETGHANDAFDAFESALEIDIQDHFSLAHLADIYYAENEVAQAIGYLATAIQIAPDNVSYKDRFVHIAATASMEQYNPVIADVLLQCLKTPTVETSRLQTLWLSLMTHQHDFKKIYKTTSTGIPAFDPSAFNKATDLSILNNDLFLQGLRRLSIYHPAFESFLTHLRGQLLETLSGGKKIALEKPESLAEALAHYCFATEYIFNISPAEEAQLDSLFQAITHATAPPAALAICVYACYAPLMQLGTQTCDALLESSDQNIKSLAQKQITDMRTLEAAKDNISAITEIDNLVSQKVRAQYEAFPYPRWQTLGEAHIPPDISQQMTQTPKSILAAGCGTGREALQIARKFPDADVLAVDLSLTSLAYAQQKAKALDVKNISFHQADILKLPALGRKFDYITSSGVVHHMESPEAGWQSLAAMLNENGMLKIGVYSEAARWAVLEAHQAIEKNGFQNTAADMRRFRQTISKLLPQETVLNLLSMGDYFHMSMFRDFLFHVQEHRFDIPRIEKNLRDNNLSFIRFSAPQAVTHVYQQFYKDAPETLARWHELEQKVPDLFREMYQFWSVKKRA